MTRLFCTFRLGDLFLGVGVEQVQEVLRAQRLTRVPLASPVISGLINLRGQIVTALDLRRRLGLPASDGSEPMNVVLRRGDGAISLLVDEIGDVLSVSDDLFEPPPETLRGPARGLVRGAYKLRDRLLLHLDTDEILNFDGAARSAPNP